MSLLYLALALAIGRFAHRRLLGWFGGGTLQHLVRLPGNLLHELAHAIVMLATGYTVTGFRVSLFDASGRGHVTPGPAWTTLARPWLTNLCSPVAPAAFGLIALAAMQARSGLPGLPSQVAGVLPVLAAVPWAQPALWVTLALGFSVAAEMAPSDVDLGVWWRPALVLLLVVVALVGGVVYLGGLGLRAETVIGAAQAVDAAIAPACGRALTLTVASGFAVAPVAWLARRFGRAATPKRA